MGERDSVFSFRFYEISLRFIHSLMCKTGGEGNQRIKETSCGSDVGICQSKEPPDAAGERALDRESGPAFDVLGSSA